MSNKVLIIFALLSLFAGCQSPAPIVPAPNDKTTILSLRVGGGELSSSSSQGDLLAVQIYAYDQKGVKTPYAYGLYDNLSIGDVTLIEGNEYSIESTYLCDGKERIASSSSQKYYAPLALYPNQNIAVTNALITSNNYFCGLMSGESKIASGPLATTYSRALVERYAGSTGVFTAGGDKEVSLSLSRVYSLLRLNVEGLTTGAVILELDGTEPIVLEIDNLSTTKDFVVGLAGTTPASAEWTQDDYGESVDYVVYLLSAEDNEQEISRGTLTLVRSKILPVNIKFNSTDLSLDIEQDEMEELPQLDIVI